MRKNPYEAGGFAFPNGEMRDKALREQEGIRYIKENTQMDDPEMVLRVYCQLIDQKLFETPVGYHFLCNMQEQLMSVPYFMTENIPPIPVAGPKRAPKPAERQSAAADTKEKVQVKKKVVTERKYKNVDFKMRFRTSFAFNVILLLIVVGMFIITATSDNINIVNYENALIEKYEKWELKLEEKEERLKEREEAVRGLEE